jgi:hypothetical protein
VRLDDDVWLDIQTSSKAVDPARIGVVAEGTDIIAEMHGLITAQLGHDRGERAHTTGTAWAAGR